MNDVRALAEAETPTLMPKESPASVWNPLT
jgi:hypothetical protein